MHHNPRFRKLKQILGAPNTDAFEQDAEILKPQTTSGFDGVHEMAPEF
jgi:hypothetical protein